MNEMYSFSCLSCGSVGFKETIKPILYETYGVEFWIPGYCYECKLCGNEMMNGEQMNEFRKKLKVAIHGQADTQDREGNGESGEGS